VPPPVVRLHEDADASGHAMPLPKLELEPQNAEKTMPLQRAISREVSLQLQDAIKPGKKVLARDVRRQLRVIDWRTDGLWKEHSMQDACGASEWCLGESR